LQCGDASDPAHTGTATATDNCVGIVTIAFSDASAGGCTGRDINRTWTATDVCGNSASCVQRIVFVDSTVPTITHCPTGGDLGFNPPAGTLPTCASVRALVQATDNCSSSVDLTFHQDDVVGTCIH